MLSWGFVDTLNPSDGPKDFFVMKFRSFFIFRIDK